MPITFEIVGTGITQRLQLVLSGTLSGDAETGFRFYMSPPVTDAELALVNAHFAALARESTWEGKLAFWEAVCREVLVHGKPPPWEQDTPEAFASSFLNSIDLLRTVWARGDRGTGLHLAMKLAEAWATVRDKFTWEADVLFGRRIRQSARRGGKAHGHDKRATWEQRFAEWQQVADRLWHEHDKWSHRAVALHVSKQVGGSVHTIRKHIKKPQPR
jgi:hypothetical protein